MINVHQLDRRILLDHLRAVEERFPLHFLGLLPRGTTAHVLEENAFDLLAEKRDGLSLLGLAKAEVELSERIGEHPGSRVLAN